MVCGEVLKCPRDLGDREKVTTNYLDFSDLKNKIIEYCKKGQWSRDSKHHGFGGPRYKVIIPVTTAQAIAVIIEKTPRCLLPITVWLESVR